MRTTMLLLAAAAIFAGCSKSDNPTASDPARGEEATDRGAAEEPAGPAIDACELLTSEEVQAVLGEPIKDLKRHERTEGILAVTQCLFELPPPENTVILTVTQKSTAPEARDPREVWADTFLKDEARPPGRKKINPPRPIEGLGDGAFWTGRKSAGGLYVLKGNSYFRINLGGRDETDRKIEKCKALAEKVLARSF